MVSPVRIRVPPLTFYLEIAGINLLRRVCAGAPTSSLRAGLERGCLPCIPKVVRVLGFVTNGPSKDVRR
jgi:hypothetical protein